MKNLFQRVIHRVSYLLSFPFVWWYVNPRYGTRRVAGADRVPDPPFFMLSNHGTFLDPWLIGQFSKAPTFYMCNDDAWRAGPVTQRYLNWIGAFPKKKGGVDYKALKATLRYLNHGAPVCIFPEGQTSWDGETQLIYKGMERLIKKAAVPVVIFNLCGNFLVKPWWAETRRKGRVLIDIKVLTPEQIASLSDDELFAEIKNGVYHNEIKDERNLAESFRGQALAEGLERFVWICMQCESEDRLVTKGDEITCRECGARWHMDAHCRLQPLGDNHRSLPDLKDWADMHRERVLARIRESGGEVEMTHSDEVVLQTPAEDGYTFVRRAAGRLSLTKETLTFSPADHDHFALSIPVADIKDTVIQEKDLFELRHDDHYYRFAFEKHSPMKWLFYLRYLRGYEEYETRGYL